MNQQQNKHYQHYIVAFMSFLHDVPYTKTTVFTPDVLRTVTPEDVRRYMCVKAFGVEEPAEDDRPLNCRANSLEVLKKAIS